MGKAQLMSCWEPLTNLFMYFLTSCPQWILQSQSVAWKCLNNLILMINALDNIRFITFTAFAICSLKLTVVPVLAVQKMYGTASTTHMQRRTSPSCMQSWPLHGLDTATAVPHLPNRLHTSASQTSTLHSLTGPKDEEPEPQSANGWNGKDLYPALPAILFMSSCRFSLVWCCTL